MSLAEFFSTALGDDLGKVTITAKLIIQKKNYCKTTMSELKRLIFTLSADSGLQNIVSLYPQETKCLSVRDKIMIANLEIYLVHRNTTNCVIFLHSNLNNMLIQDWDISFQQYSYLISIFHGVDNRPKGVFLNTPGHRIKCENLF